MTPKALADLLAAAIHEDEAARGCSHFPDGNWCEYKAARYLGTPSGLALLERVERAERLEAVAEEARLVGQWWDAVDLIPDELRGELLDLYDHAADALAAPTHPEEEG